jgi:hypothetical protein
MARGARSLLHTTTIVNINGESYPLKDQRKG